MHAACIKARDNVLEYLDTKLMMCILAHNLMYFIVLC